MRKRRDIEREQMEYLTGEEFERKPLRFTWINSFGERRNTGRRHYWNKFAPESLESETVRKLELLGIEYLEQEVLTIYEDLSHSTPNQSIFIRRHEWKLLECLPFADETECPWKECDSPAPASEYRKNSLNGKRYCKLCDHEKGEHGYIYSPTHASIYYRTLGPTKRSV